MYLKGARHDLEDSGFKVLKKADYRTLVRAFKAKEPEPPKIKKLNKLLGTVVFVKEHTRHFPRQTRL
jgi:hypothetical protein